MQVIEQEKNLTRYLLGVLSPKERSEIEASYVADADFFDQLLVAEDQLIDDYVRGRLSASDRKLFEENFLCTSERRERLKSARALMSFVDKHAQPQATERAGLWQTVKSLLRVESPAFRWVLATGFLIALVGGPVALLRISRLSSELRSLRETQIAQQQKAQDLEQSIARQNESFNHILADERRERGRLEQELENVREDIKGANQSAPPPVVYALGPGSADGFPRGAGSGIPRLVISKDRPKVQLRFEVSSGESRSYLVSLIDPQGKEVWRGDVRNKGNKITITLPARLFSTGTYRIVLSDSEALVGYERYYQLEVEKK